MLIKKRGGGLMNGRVHHPHFSRFDHNYEELLLSLQETLK